MVKSKDCFSLDDLIKAAKDINKKYPDLFEERKPYNPPSLYKRASKLEIVWIRIISSLKRLIKLWLKTVNVVMLLVTKQK